MYMEGQPVNTSLPTPFAYDAIMQRSWVAFFNWVKDELLRSNHCTYSHAYSVRVGTPQ
jgi:hypothetical protein